MVSKINNLSLIFFYFNLIIHHQKSLSHKEVRKAFVYFHYTHLRATLTSPDLCQQNNNTTQ
ncbi:hypothetical protein M084_2922 [Bacteroides fragilis str. 3988 T1]|nr:hypothetical protein M084_2922 [Bacteroides fragilis str. 3988 T1]